MLTAEDRKVMGLVARNIEDVRQRFGFARPVVLQMLAEEGPAAAVLEAIRATLPDSKGPFFALPAADVAELLTECCGPGGAFLARLLIDQAAALDGWLLQLDREVLTFTGFAEGKPALFGSRRYDDERRGQGLSDLLRDPGPSCVPFVDEAGAVAQVFGRSGLDLCRAAMLAAQVESGRLRGDGLAKELLGYLKGDGPAQVAEAVRALKKLPGGKEKPLVRMLRNRPELAGLNLAVRAELDGVAGAGF